MSSGKLEEEVFSPHFLLIVISLDRQMMLKVYFGRWGSLCVLVNCKALPLASKLLVWLAILDRIWVRCQGKVPLSVGLWRWWSHPNYGFEENLIEKVSTVLAAWKKLTGVNGGRQGLYQAVVQEKKKKADWPAGSVSLFVTKSMVVLIWIYDTNLPDTTLHTLTVSFDVILTVHRR